MIFVKDSIYAKVWEIDKQEKYADLRISTSEKDKDGNYIYSSWFARAIGKAFKNIDNIKPEDRITITKAKLSNTLYKDKDGNTKSSFRFLIFEFECENNSQKAESAGIELPADGDSDEDLPF